MNGFRLRGWLIGLALLQTPVPTWAFVPFTASINGTAVRVRWPAGRTSIPFAAYAPPLRLLPDPHDQNAWLTAVDAALAAWSLGPVDPYLGGTTNIAEGRYDGVNVITAADTTANRDMVGNSTGTALLWIARQGSQNVIVETDVILATRSPFATDGRADALDVQSTLASEIGNALGLDHSPIAAATMFPFNEPGVTYKRSLHPDDLAGLRAIYNFPDPGSGSIAGRVVTAGPTPIFGAHVVATNAEGIVQVGVLTERDGSFTLPYLAPGNYQVYAEPLDGPVPPTQLTPAYSSASRTFQTAFAGGNASPTTIPVRASATTMIDPIEVARAIPDINPQFLGWSPDGYVFDDVAQRNLTIKAGQTAFVAIAGKGLDSVPRSGFSVSGGDVILHTGHFFRDVTMTGTPSVVLPLSVRPGARPGARNLYLTMGTERAAFTGCIEVVGP